jgi:hypothetical protein
MAEDCRCDRKLQQKLALTPDRPVGRFVQPACRFYMGHGGPLEAAEVMRHARSLSDFARSPCTVGHCAHPAHRSASYQIGTMARWRRSLRHSPARERFCCTPAGRALWRTMCSPGVAANCTRQHACGDRRRGSVVGQCRQSFLGTLNVRVRPFRTLRAFWRVLQADRYRAGCCGSGKQ